MRTLGLDISSSIIGIAVADKDEKGVIKPLFLDHIRLDNIDGIFEKYDEVCHRLSEMQAAGAFDGVERTAVEAPLLGFQTAKSTAQTIITLIRINVLTSLKLREMFGKDPDFISSSTARRLAGIKVQRRDKANGMSGKEQVFEHMCNNDLSHVDWPKRKLGKKKGKPVEFAKDITDAWVIAKACCVQQS